MGLDGQYQWIASQTAIQVVAVVVAVAVVAVVEQPLLMPTDVVSSEVTDHAEREHYGFVKMLQRP